MLGFPPQLLLSNPAFTPLQAFHVRVPALSDLGPQLHNAQGRISPVHTGNEFVVLLGMLVGWLWGRWDWQAGNGPDPS